MSDDTPAPLVWTGNVGVTADGFQAEITQCRETRDIAVRITTPPGHPVVSSTTAIRRGIDAPRATAAAMLADLRAGRVGVAPM